jgi:hypothetical protein
MTIIAEKSGVVAGSLLVERALAAIVETRGRYPPAPGDGPRCATMEQ